MVVKNFTTHSASGVQVDTTENKIIIRTVKKIKLFHYSIDFKNQQEHAINLRSRAEYARLRRVEFIDFYQLGQFRSCQTIPLKLKLNNLFSVQWQSGSVYTKLKIYSSYWNAIHAQIFAQKHEESKTIRNKKNLTWCLFQSIISTSRANILTLSLNVAQIETVKHDGIVYRGYILFFCVFSRTRSKSV